MFKAAGITFAAALLLSACSQFTTNDTERSQLRAAADQQAEAYLSCVRREATQFDGTNSDAAFIYTAVADRCVAAMDDYRESAKAYFETRVIMTEKPVEAEVDELARRARTVIAELMVSGAPVAASAGPAATIQQATQAMPAEAPQVSAGGDWAPEQRVYLDCMLEQAKRYAQLDERAETVAEVAQNNCRNYLGGSNSGGLAQEGRALVLREVFDARVNQQGR